MESAENSAKLSAQSPPCNRNRSPRAAAASSLLSASTSQEVTSGGSLDLAQPRLQALSLTGGGAGAWGAQMNQWEALTVFTAANFIAFTQGVDPAGSWATASIVWLAARLLHGVFYVMEQATLRVACFVASLAMSVWIIVMAM